MEIVTLKKSFFFFFKKNRFKKKKYNSIHLMKNDFFDIFYSLFYYPYPLRQYTIPSKIGRKT